MPDKPKNKGGRPRTHIEYTEVQKLAAIQCTDAEIASWIGMTEEGFRKRKKSDKQLVGALKDGRDRGKSSIRRMMFQAAEKGNATMLVWLSKNVLGYTDKIDQKNDNKVEIVVKMPTDE